jgi:Holliday junction resolvase
MANPLQPKCNALLEDVYGAYIINITGASKSGHMDTVACIKGQFYGFEYKWKTDQPSELQKDKINKCIDAGGKAYFVRSIEQLHHILRNKLEPTKYPLKKTFNL